MLSAPWLVKRFSKKEQHDNFLLRKYHYPRWVNSYLSKKVSAPEIARIKIELRIALFASDPRYVSEERWGWKNPPTIYFLPLLNEMYPHMRFIHVVRDGRDHAFHPRFAYSQQKALLTPEELELDKDVRRALVWSKANLLARHAGETYLQGRYIYSRLEDLCTNPSQEIERLHTFLNVPPGPQVEEVAKIVATPSSSERWRKQPPEKLIAVENAVADTLSYYNYKLATRSV